MPHLRFLTAGESHGPSLLVLLEGIPAGLPLRAHDINEELARRQRGYGRGGRMKIERDTVHLDAGVRGGETLGSPLALRIENKDFANWAGRMGPEPFEQPPEPVTLPRPGHADLAGALKYDRHDARDILERASARETAARVAAGAVAKVFLAQLGIELASRVVSIGAITDTTRIAPAELLTQRTTIEASELRVLDQQCAEQMKQHILEAAHDGDTLGGVVEVVAVGVPVGLGSHVQWDRRLDGRIAQAMLSVPAMKAVELGDGWNAAQQRGSKVHDPIGYDASKRTFTRASNHAGGVEGGMSNGAPLVVRVAMKPIATLKKALPSADLRTKEEHPAAHERSDVCAVPAAGVILEAMLGLTLADAVLEKFGGDSLREVLRNAAHYREQCEQF